MFKQILSAMSKKEKKQSYTCSTKALMALFHTIIFFYTKNMQRV